MTIGVWGVGETSIWLRFSNKKWNCSRSSSTTMHFSKIIEEFNLCDLPLLEDNIPAEGA